MYSNPKYIPMMPFEPFSAISLFLSFCVYASPYASLNILCLFLEYESGVDLTILIPPREMSLNLVWNPLNV